MFHQKIFAAILLVASTAHAIDWQQAICIDEIQEYNKDTLINTLQDGWTSFCSSDVDEGVLAIYPGSDIVDVTVDVSGKNGSATWPLRDVCKICTLNFEQTRKTLVVANGWVSDGVYDVKRKVQEITQCCNDYNVIIVDFATRITQLYKTKKRNIEVAAYAVLKVLDVLLLNNVLYHDIVLVGFSTGAQIAALSAQLFARDRLWNQSKLPLLVAIDPAPACAPEQNYLNADVTDQVLVIHGNNDNYGIKAAVGTVDFYPNGDGKLQAGCKSQVCSHIFALWVWVESVCYPSNFLAVKCKDWSTFTKGNCVQNDVIPINLDLPNHSSGKFYAQTKSQSPYGCGKEGTKPAKLKL